MPVETTPALRLPHPRCSASFAVLRERPCLRTVCKGSRTQPNPHVLQRQEAHIPLSQTCVARLTRPFLPCCNSPNFARTCGCSYKAIAIGNSVVAYSVERGIAAVKN